MQPDQSQYNFIMESPGGSNGGPAFLQDPKKRNFIAIGFVAVIIFLAIIVVAVFASLGKKDNTPLVDVVAYQTELLRISEIGLEGSKDLSTRSYASTLQSFIQSDLSKTTGYLASNGKKLENTETSAKANKDVDKDLESAALRNTFDEVLLGFFEKTSQEYKASLQKALNSTSSEKEKAILETAAKNILTFEGTQEKSGVSAPAEVTKL
jgi:hypothetical protein